MRTTLGMCRAPLDTWENVASSDTRELCAPLVRPLSPKRMSVNVCFSESTLFTSSRFGVRALINNKDRMHTKCVSRVGRRVRSAGFVETTSAVHQTRLITCIYRAHKRQTSRRKRLFPNVRPGMYDKTYRGTSEDYLIQTTEWCQRRAVRSKRNAHTSVITLTNHACCRGVYCGIQ